MNQKWKRSSQQNFTKNVLVKSENKKVKSHSPSAKIYYADCKN
jgi:hypothetical protein